MWGIGSTRGQLPTIKTLWGLTRYYLENSIGNPIDFHLFWLNPIPDEADTFFMYLRQPDSFIIFFSHPNDNDLIFDVAYYFLCYLVTLNCLLREHWKCIIFGLYFWRNRRNNRNCNLNVIGQIWYGRQGKIPQQKCSICILFFNLGLSNQKRYN